MTDKQNDGPDVDVDAAENEILSGVRESRAQKEAADASEAEAKGKDTKRGFGWKKASAIGIGSAAVLAALLYANRDKR